MATLAQNLPADAAVPVEGGPKSKKKLLLMLALIMLLLGGTSAWLLMPHKAAQKEAEKLSAKAPVGPPLFVVMDPFTVNLQPDGQFLQATFTLQMSNQDESNTIKMYMPQVRSRLLLMLSNKNVTELSSVEGKTQLGNEIAGLIELPFSSGVKPVKVSNVFFTSFVIQ